MQSEPGFPRRSLRVTRHPRSPSLRSGCEKVPPGCAGGSRRTDVGSARHKGGSAGAWRWTTQPRSLVTRRAGESANDLRRWGRPAGSMCRHGSVWLGLARSVRQVAGGPISPRRLVPHGLLSTQRPSPKRLSMYGRPAACIACGWVQTSNGRDCCTWVTSRSRQGFDAGRLFTMPKAFPVPY